MGLLRNFSAGPGALPGTVLQQAQQAVLELPGTGISILGLSHRSVRFRAMLDEAEERIRRLLMLPPSYRVLFLQGGGTLQFSMVPMTLLQKGSAADYIVGGYWSRKAVDAARYHGEVRVAWSGAAGGYRTLPRRDEAIGSDSGAYLHYVSNETVEGLQFRQVPLGSAPLVCDMSSDFLSRPLDVRPFSLIYAHAQKNFGPAGVTVALVNDDVLSRVPRGLPPILDYRAHVEAGSLLHTPPVFAIYVVLLVLRWLEEEVGGLAQMAKATEEKARLVYAALDDSNGFYCSHSEGVFRSEMNAVFRCPTPELDARFVADAAAAGFVGMEGHRSVGGLRISLYNGVSVDDARAIAGFLGEFAAEHRDSAYSRAVG